MPKPKVTVNPVANAYTSANERIVEYSHKGLGGLMALRALDDGTLLVNLYRHDEGVLIRVSPAEGAKTWPVDDEEEQRFTDWQDAVKDRDTHLGFREWLTNEEDRA
jgi:hypothetical protein